MLKKGKLEVEELEAEELETEILEAKELKSERLADEKQDAAEFDAALQDAEPSIYGEGMAAVRDLGATASAAIAALNQAVADMESVKKGMANDPDRFTRSIGPNGDARLVAIAKEGGDVFPHLMELAKEVSGLARAFRNECATVPGFVPKPYPQN
jgi:hypothetical protein